ncbi:MAG: hypothetical protein DRN12_02875 [Thermoplasmata archaeon]|nr:MAG: hypothetical protein DRN12_02875 [Thermoplasmata archaeon]HEC88959.1 sulfite exporter TauE/SafE family protein [Thermoplasmatales archaeon]
MIEDYSTLLGLLVAGFGSGVSVGMGSGTASPIIIPILTLLISSSIHQAIGTSLFVDFIIGCTAGVLFLFHSRVNFKTVLYLGIPGLIGAIVGSRFTSSASETGLNLFLGIIVIFIGINFLVNGIQKNLDLIQNKISFEWFRENSKIFFPVSGIILGGISGFLGIGVSGIIALILIFVVQYDIHTAIGTSLLIMSFIAGAGAIGHIASREIIWTAAIFAATGASIGALSGSTFANKINSDLLGRILGGIILLLGILITVRTILF